VCNGAAPLRRDGRVYRVARRFGFEFSRSGLAGGRADHEKRPLPRPNICIGFVVKVCRASSLSSETILKEDVNMENRPKVCIDRILPRELMQLQRTKPMRDGGRRAIAPIGKTWMNGSTLRVRFLEALRPSRPSPGNRLTVLRPDLHLGVSMESEGENQRGRGASARSRRRVANERVVQGKT